MLGTSTDGLGLSPRRPTQPLRANRTSTPGTDRRLAARKGGILSENRRSISESPRKSASVRRVLFDYTPNASGSGLLHCKCAGRITTSIASSPAISSETAWMRKTSGQRVLSSLAGSDWNGCCIPLFDSQGQSLPFAQLDAQRDCGRPHPDRRSRRITREGNRSSLHWRSKTVCS
jgi:hypothetical protein